ncbi:hypothetical protein CEXT_328141 [Caerostris extrusa]|uniref:Ig-like domain-containing protein n=1 Tax=Caerostris extrusa TaxID=172846 RepID=A0AAV4XI35_CAEEX|nr:hypothetical protein CEXT_328141 [Caerostris extrusa]
MHNTKASVRLKPVFPSPTEFLPQRLLSKRRIPHWCKGEVGVGERVDSSDALYEGAELTIIKVSRLNMGTYLCVANNGIPPTAVKKTMLHVHSYERSN